MIKECTDEELVYMIHANSDIALTILLDRVCEAVLSTIEGIIKRLGCYEVEDAKQAVTWSQPVRFLMDYGRRCSTCRPLNRRYRPHLPESCQSRIFRGCAMTGHSPCLRGNRFSFPLRNPARQASVPQHVPVFCIPVRSPALPAAARHGRAPAAGR